jgi:hypothetical protein
MSLIMVTGYPKHKCRDQCKCKSPGFKGDKFSFTQSRFSLLYRTYERFDHFVMSVLSGEYYFPRKSFFKVAGSRTKTDFT